MSYDESNQPTEPIEPVNGPQSASSYPTQPLQSMQNAQPGASQPMSVPSTQPTQQSPQYAQVPQSMYGSAYSQQSPMYTPRVVSTPAQPPVSQAPQSPQVSAQGYSTQTYPTQSYPTQAFQAQQASQVPQASQIPSQTPQSQTAQPQTTQPQSARPGAPMYDAATAKAPRNHFADPANAYGTPASVTAAGMAINAQSLSALDKKNRRTTIWTSLGAAALAALLVAGIGAAAISNGLLTVPSSSSLNSITSSTGSVGTTSSSASGVNWTSVAKKVSASVVSIQGTVSGGSVIGSGAILDKDGNIIINNHVVSGASNLKVTLSNGNIYDASVVGTDPTTDLAVIKLKNAPSNLTPVEFANSDNLAVGESVMAIGSPLGYENTATTGVVSALNRPVSVSAEDSDATTVVTNAVQIDASINSGNSGGPTFNSDGKLIGINSSIATTGSSSSSSSNSGSIGIGFAIPANLAQWVTSSIIKNGKATHVALGVTVKTATAKTSDGTTRAGSQVQSVVSGSAASEAGLQQGDTIVAYNKHSVGSNEALLGYVRATQKGETVTLTVIRDGKTIDLTVKMNHEETSSSSSSSSNSQNQQNNGNNNRNGFGSNDDDSDSEDESNPFEQFFGGND
ncbi:trypsin-like peptidase domain-containing protein [Alloscardovia venturai]|uniref:Trypsin-like peptidase domain-containing protein n=1 Tax=Alloscardovia venturai TaxID=1769421 RepID=A0ABW2Y2L2_9BIFI